MPAENATQRFSDRVADYIRYRPGYPPTLLARLAATGARTVADIGAGTGILTAALLDHFPDVRAVAPNDARQDAAASLLADRPGLTLRSGRAEATGLPDQSVDLIGAAQAFHWFDPAPTRAEFQRILRPGGQVALIWNNRLADATPFLRAYEALLLARGTDYAEVNHRNIGPEQLDAFFGPGRWQRETFDNAQHFDREGLRGRLRSSSYTPPPGHPDHAPLLAALDDLFDAHVGPDGRVDFLYVTELFLGALG